MHIPFNELWIQTKVDHMTVMIRLKQSRAECKSKRRRWRIEDDEWEDRSDSKDTHGPHRECDRTCLSPISSEIQGKCLFCFSRKACHAGMLFTCTQLSGCHQYKQIVCNFSKRMKSKIFCVPHHSTTQFKCLKEEVFLFCIAQLCLDWKLTNKPLPTPVVWLYNSKSSFPMDRIKLPKCES